MKAVGIACWLLLMVAPAFAQSSTRSLTDCYTPETAFEVTLDVDPGSGATSFSCIDKFPAGWTVSNPSDGGSIVTQENEVRWFFFSGSAKQLKYTVTPPANSTGDVAFSGRIAVAGTPFDTTGDSSIAICPPSCFVLTITSGTTVTATNCTGGYNSATVVSISANTPPPGKVFDAWTGDTSTVENVNSASTTITMDANKSVTATYIDAPSECFTLTVVGGTRNTATDCTASGSVGGYTMNKVVSISANTPPPTGKVFDAWTGDTSTVENVNSASTTITMDANKSVTATYIDAPSECFTLTVVGGTRNTATDCTASGSVGGYTMNKVVSISANTPPPTGKVFDAWTGDTSTVENVNSASTTITMDANKSVTATYKDAPNCTLTVSGGSTSVPAAGGTTETFGVDVISNTCGWTVATDVGTTSVSGGTGDGTFTVTVPANTDTAARTVMVTVTPEENPSGAVVENIAQADDGGGELQSELVNRTVNYLNCWERNGTVQVPGATRVRLVLDDLAIESCCDTLTIFGDTPEEYRGEGGPFTTPFKAGDSIELFMDSDDSVEGSFKIVTVEYEGVSTGEVTFSDELFTGTNENDCPGGEGEGECEILAWYGGSYSISSVSFAEELWVDMSSEECGWEFRSDTPGVEFSPASGTGDATVNVFVPENFGAERVIVIYIASIENEASNFFSNYIQSGVEGGGEGEGEGGPCDGVSLAECLLDNFSSADSDGNGALGYEEANAWVGGNLDPSEFSQLDSNGNGAITRGEIDPPIVINPGCILDKFVPLDGLRKSLGDIFLIGLAIATLTAYSALRKRG